MSAAGATSDLGHRALVAGFGVTGRAVVRYLRDRGHAVTVVDDRPSPELEADVTALGAVLVGAPDAGTLRGLLATADFVSPSPGLPPTHPLFAAAAAAQVPVLGEIELGARAVTAPIVAVTGTNGKTTVTTVIAHVAEEGGRKAVLAGNIGTPLVDVVDSGADLVALEVSSFQLTLTESLHPRVAVWLNFAEDHRDWHASMEEYAEAKARIWRNQSGDDVAVVNGDDEVVMRHAAGAPARVVTFGAAGDWRVERGRIVGPDGLDVVAVADLPRTLPHDVDNALAAAAAAHAAGIDVDALARGLRSTPSLPHRVSLVGEAGGVRWYDDSKATTPVSVIAAVRSFDSVVLIAGGRNKGLDLGVLGSVADHIRAVVAIGEAAPLVRAAFSTTPVEDASSMDEAVQRAGALAHTGDAVLLSPGCASYDWYRNYGERGDDFARAVREHVLEGSA